MTYEEFLRTRKNINLNLIIRNLITFIISSMLGYQILNSLPNIYGLMIGATVASSLSIFIVKMRNFRTEKKYNTELMDFIQSAIKEARLNNDYLKLNSLLDSKYTSYVVLGMSKFPEGSFDFNELSKWENLPKAIKYFKENNFTEEDLKDQTKMVSYMKAVVPHFFKA